MLRFRLSLLITAGPVWVRRPLWFSAGWTLKLLSLKDCRQLNEQVNETASSGSGLSTKIWKRGKGGRRSSSLEKEKGGGEGQREGRSEEKEGGALGVLFCWLCLRVCCVVCMWLYGRARARLECKDSGGMSVFAVALCCSLCFVLWYRKHDWFNTITEANHNGRRAVHFGCVC
jgi:hypothetical protein